MTMSLLKNGDADITPGPDGRCGWGDWSRKSTLKQLIPRLFDPQEGSIKIGGKDIRASARELLHHLATCYSL